MDLASVEELNNNGALFPVVTCLANARAAQSVNGRITRIPNLEIPASDSLQSLPQTKGGEKQRRWLPLLRRAKHQHKDTHDNGTAEAWVPTYVNA